MKKYTGFVKKPLTLLVLLTHFKIIFTAVPISNVLAYTLSQQLDKLNYLKESASSNNYTDSPQAREPGGYGHSGGHSKGYGHGSSSGHGHGHGAITLDPVSIISLLALGAFLINNILQLLRANAAPSGRSLDVSDLNVPLDLSDFGSAAIELETNYGQRRSSREDDEKPSFSKFFENVGSLYYLHPKKRNVCIKKVVCTYVSLQQSRDDHQGTVKTRIFDLMLSTITRFVAPEIHENGRSDMCEKFNKLCSDSLLQDAKISTENKVYSQVTSLISNFALSKFMSG